jgi:hypothetical protein
MEYADRGEMVSAWAQFAADCTAHDDTAYIATDDQFGKEMYRQVQAGAGVKDFKDFISGWAVRS